MNGSDTKPFFIVTRAALRGDIVVPLFLVVPDDGSTVAKPLSTAKPLTVESSLFLDRFDDVEGVVADLDMVVVGGIDL